ncbi:unnamed protein product [Hyaloperonospora brassicae]|uniref:Uncharacterized protein n=1 Tax=Hyaloperonospora brassicae TaxID=162125 RepID=A0AAV0UK50_HYABA|nr:unnamed protein product [Hyaloperonospora brassicae]
MRSARFFARRMATAAGRRTMASSHGRHGQEYPHGMHFHVSPVHKNLALAYGTMLWLWVFWRAKQDGLALLGFEHPWDHHGHDSAASHSLGDKSHSDGEALPVTVLSSSNDESEEFDVLDDLHDVEDE